RMWKRWMLVAADRLLFSVPAAPAPEWMRGSVRLGPFFFLNVAAAPEISTLSLHDALPISCLRERRRVDQVLAHKRLDACPHFERSEEHTSELQLLAYLVCRLLLEKKNDHVDPAPRPLPPPVRPRRGRPRVPGRRDSRGGPP